jgi:PadR family transcriptional regulator PadR
MGKPSDLLQGTLEMLVLRTLETGPQHGWAIARRIQQTSGDVLQVQQGSLYPALYRLERAGAITGAWRPSETGRQARFYSLTPAGERRLEQVRAQWRRLSAAVELVMEGAKA